MAIEIIMPKAGMDMEEGTVIKWLKQEGDKVENGEPILEILTDKVNMEVEAEASGTLLKILAQEGEVLPVFSVIGYIGNDGENIPEQKTENSKNTPKENSDKAEESKVEVEIEDEISTDKVRATPASRKLAREKGVKLTDVRGTGPKGRIQLADVKAFNPTNVSVKASPVAVKIAETEGIDLSTVEGSGTSGKIMKNDIKDLMETINSMTPKDVSEKSKVEVEEKKQLIPFTGMRKIIADRMSQSAHTTAVVTLNIEVDMTNAINMRGRIKERILSDTNCKMTYTDLLIMAVSKSLKKYPIVNASLTDKGIIVHDSVNMGIAVGMDNGLMVPVISGTDKMTLSDIVTKRTDVVKRTLKGKIKPDELQGSTFTISNLGMYDTISFTSIINQPNSAILSVGTILERMRVVNGQPVVRSVMNMSITADHRVMDGLDAAKFLQYLKDLLEDPTLLLI